MHEQLEGMVDAHGLDRVLDALVDLCHGKAEHLEMAWQDTAMAQRWTRAAGHVDTARGKAQTLVGFGADAEDNAHLQDNPRTSG